MEPANARRRVEITNRRQQVAEMYLRGAYQTQIAEQLGIDQSTVSRDLAELRKEWLERSINHIDQKKAIELAKLDQLELTYWDAWERSKAVATTTISSIGTTGSSSTTKQEERVGNPSFLDGVLKCINKRCEILGLDAPRRQDLTSGGQPIKASNDDGQLNRALSTLADAIRETLSGADEDSTVDPTEQAAVGGAPEPGG